MTALALAVLLAAPRFAVQPLAVDGEVATVVAADLDGDGKKDLLASYTTGLPPGQKRFLAIFWNRDGVFAPRPDLTVPVAEEDACAFDVGSELYILTPRGVLAQSFKGRAAGPLRKILEQPTLFHQPIPGELPRVNIVQELGLLVPALGSLGIWKAAAGGWEKAAELEMDMEVSGGRRERHSAALGPIGVHYEFPALHLFDTDGDGLTDVIAVQEDRVAIYRGPVFRAQPDYTRDFAVRTAEDHRERQSNVNVMVADLDGDGIADLVVRKQVTEGIASAQSTSYVYFGKKGGGYPQEPAQVLKSEGLSILETQLVDLTGDGRPDLVVPYTSFGVFAIIRMLTAKTVKAEYRVFPFDVKARKFSAEPASERELKFRLSLSGDSDLQAVKLSSDYTGDGKPDLAFGTGEEELSIFPGLGGGAFADDAAEKVTVRTSGTLLAADLDGKGRSDIVLYYPQTRGHRGEIVVLQNKGPW